MRELDYDLNRDILRALEEVGDPAPHELLQRYFPQRPCRPRAYERRYAMSRRVDSRLVGPKDELPVAPRRGWDLLALFGVCYTLPELERLCKRLEALEAHPALLVGLPRAPLAVAEELRELAAMEELSKTPAYAESAEATEALRAHRGYLMRRVREQLRSALRPRAFRWRHQGVPLEWSPPESRRAFFVQALEVIYPDTPTRRAASGRRALKGALDELLDRDRPLFMSCSLPCPSSAVLERTLLAAGILRVEGEGSSYRRLAVEEWPQGESPELRLWRDLTDQLYGERESERAETLAELLDWLAEPPRGLRGPVAQLYLAAALRVRPEDLELRHGDQVLELGVETFRRALEDPTRYELRYRVATRAEEAFIKNVRGLFGTSTMATLAEGDLYERTHRQLLTWLEKLPRLTRVSQHSPATQQLLALLESSRDARPRELLNRALPRVLGLQGVPLVEDQSIYLGRLDSLIQELEDFLDTRMAELAQQIQRHITGASKDGPSAVEWLDHGARAWLEGLHPGTETRRFNPWAEALRRAVLSEGPVEQRWFVELPQSLELPPVSDWHHDAGKTFLARMMQARAELELWKVQEILTAGQEPGRLKEQVQEFVHTAMELAGLTVPEREIVLLDLLDEIWA